jgi:UDP:flavonoid glycosyltransferase YjiC (YdhE family)
MSRFLFFPLPLAGHIYPAAAVAQSLEQRGHEVAWIGAEGRLRPIIGAGPVVYPTGMRPYRGQADTGLNSVRSLWQEFVVPYTRFTLPAVEKAVQAARPDVLVVDQHAMAGALVAQRHGLPWATMASSSMELTEPFAGNPPIMAWLNGLQDTMKAMAGRAGDPVDLRFSPYLVIAFISALLAGGTLPGRRFPDHWALVGPAIGARTGAPDFPWDWLDPGRRHVLVTVGTMAEANATDPTQFYTRAVRALAQLGDGVQGIIIAPDGEVPDPPPHVLTRPRVPLLDLMPHLDAVVCHGGQNTVCEALSFGVPLVIAPLTRDQPINANRVAALGAGLRVKFSRVTPDQLAAAVTTLLSDPSYRAAAGRVAGSFAAAGGAPAAAARLEQLALVQAGVPGG